MHYPPDLKLASSYIPACLCTLKSVLAFVLFVLSPVRGWIGLSCLAIVDRDLWNGNQTFILDVNSVVVSLIGGLMVMRARSDGLHGMTHIAVIVIWVLGCIPQIIGITKFHRSFEVILAGACVALLSCMYQQQERIEILALRAFVFVVMNIALPYIGIVLQQYEVDTHLNICRTLLILLGEPEVAVFWVVVYVLCLGNQVRSSQCKQTEYYHTDEETTNPTKAPTAEPAPDDVSSQLRKALAIKKELCRDV